MVVLFWCRAGCSSVTDLLFLFELDLYQCDDLETDRYQFPTLFYQ